MSQFTKVTDSKTKHIRSENTHKGYKQTTVRIGYAMRQLRKRVNEHKLNHDSQIRSHCYVFNHFKLNSKYSLKHLTMNQTQNYG